MAGFKRSIFVINPKFQFKFSLMVCSLIILSSLLYPVTIYEIFESFFRQNPSSSETLEQSRNILLTWLILIQLLYVAIVFFICIFISHKIAGPMFKLSSYLKNIAEGNTPKELYFRDGDNFKEVAELYNQAFERLKNDRLDDYQYLKEVKSYISNLIVVVPEDKKPVINEISVKIDQMLKHIEDK